MPKGLTPARIRELETDLDSRITVEDLSVSGTRLHFCYDWDGLLIDETDPEYESCGCFDA